MLEPHTRLDAMCSEWSSIPRDEVLLEDVHDLAHVPSSWGWLEFDANVQSIRSLDFEI